MEGHNRPFKKEKKIIPYAVRVTQNSMRNAIHKLLPIMSKIKAQEEEEEEDEEELAHD